MKIDLLAQLRQWANTASQEAITSTVIERLGKYSTLALAFEKRVNVFTFTYSINGKRIAGFLISSKKGHEKQPVIIFNRGGTSDFGLVTKGRLFTELAQFAQWGYIIVGSQYPGNSLSEGVDERGGKSDVESVLHLYDLIKALDNADENKIGMYGESRGGMMTYLCLKEVDWIRAALTVGGLSNLERSLKYRPEMAGLYEKHFNNTTKAKNARSVVKWPNKLNKRTPLCLLHGAADNRVSVLDTLELAEKLTHTNHPFSLHIFENGNHSLKNVREQRDMIVKDWFDRYLRNSDE